MKAIEYSPETAAALDGSIEKWRSIRDGVGEDGGSGNCALCQRFGRLCQRRDGEQCPVYARSGQEQCRGTPYSVWSRSLYVAGLDMSRRATTPELVALAQKELDFLESLKWEKE